MWTRCHSNSRGAFPSRWTEEARKKTFTFIRQRVLCREFWRTHSSVRCRQFARTLRKRILWFPGILLSSFHSRIDWYCRRVLYRHCINCPNWISVASLWTTIWFSLVSNTLCPSAPRIFQWIGPTYQDLLDWTKIKERGEIKCKLIGHNGQFFSRFMLQITYCNVTVSDALNR